MAGIEVIKMRRLGWRWRFRWGMRPVERIVGVGTRRCAGSAEGRTAKTLQSRGDRTALLGI